MSTPTPPDPFDYDQAMEAVNAALDDLITIPIKMPPTLSIQIQNAISYLQMARNFININKPKK